MAKFFSFDPDNGFDFHNTAELAKAECEKAFQYHREEAACDGWSEEVGQVCWGEIKEQAVLVREAPRPAEDELDEDGFDADGITGATVISTQFKTGRSNHHELHQSTNRRDERKAAR